MHVLMKGSGELSAGRAVKQLRKLSDGGEIALTGSVRGSSPTAPLLNLSAAREWLSHLDGVALYVHDDVSFDRTDLELLREVHLSSHSLTSGRLAPGDLDVPADIPLIIGTPAMIADLLGGIVGKIEQVDDVRPEHDRKCARVIARPLLVASMIVKDEADQIGECLDSLAGLVDRVEIVDTGSSDDTIAIARGRGASVTTTEWTDDFAAARNLALDQCRDAQFVLHVDADERVDVEDPVATRTMLESSGIRAARIQMRNLVGDRVTSEFEAVRVFSTDETKWMGRVHEYPADLDGTPLSAVRMGGLRIDHSGYHPDVVTKKDKWNRNLALAEAAYEAEPSFKTRLDLARSLAWRSDNDRAFAMFAEAAADLTGANAEAAAYVIAHVALAHQLDGDLDSAHRLAGDALGRCSGEFIAHLARARAWRATGDDRAIVDAHAHRCSSNLEPPMFDTAATRIMTDTLTVGALARLGRHVDALELAVSVLESDPARFDEWKSLASMPADMRRVGLGLLASMDLSGGFVDALLGEIPMSELAALVLAHAAAPEPAPHAIVTGIMAAVLAEDETTATRIAELGAHALDGEQRSAAAERCRLRDATTVADLLDPVRV